MTDVRFQIYEDLSHLGYNVVKYIEIQLTFCLLPI
jgi:hypothetical protein